MKKTIRIVAVLLLLAVWGSSPYFSGRSQPVPLCWPKPCTGLN